MSMSDLRRAAAADAPVCARLLQDWLDATPWMPKLHDLAETEGWMAGVLFPSSEVWMLGEAEGFLALQDRAEIAQLILAPKARGRGRGRLLIDAAKARAADQLALWCFAANASALRFYAREGFEVTGGTAGENDEGLPDLRLTWRRA